MANYQIKGKTQKAYRQNPAKETIIPKNCVAVFPMLIVSGQTFITEHGTMPQNLTYDKGSFLFWQEVFDGRHSIKIQWEDAVLLEKPEGKNYYLAETKVGKYYYGKPISNTTESLEIGEDESFDEFITMKTEQSVKIRFEFQKSNRLMFDKLAEDLRFVDNDLYKLYLIPELCEGKLMYISDYEEGYEDKTGLSYWCEITFQTLGSRLQKSGKAVEQYPQWSAPGEFYVKPKIEYSVGEVQEKRIIIDPSGLNPDPIKYLQAELQGPALTACLYALGRRQEKDPETGKWKIGASHHLLGVNFVSTQPNPLNRTSTPTKNYDCFYDEEVCFATNAEFLSLLTDKISQPLEQLKNGGLISLGENSTWKSGNPATGIHKSNDPDNNNGSRFDYYDSTWRPLNYDGVPDALIRNTNGCVYAEEEIAYNKANDTMIDIMNKNVFQFNQQPIIPLSMYATRPFYLKSIPIVGSIANFFSLGDIHLFNNTTNRKTSHLIYFGDADLCALCANLQQGLIDDTKGWHPFSKAGMVAFPVNFFGNNETSYNKLGVNSVNTTFCIELTDLISLTTHGSTKTYNTLLLGQSTNEDGTPIFPDKPEDTLLVNGTMKAQEALNTGFIIDAVIVQTIFDGKIRLSCYTDQDNEFLIPAWTTTILSNANWQGGAMRDWTNMYLLSNWTDRFCRQQDQFTWPLPPHKPSTEEIILTPDIHANYEKKFEDKNIGEAFGSTLGKYKNVDLSNHLQRNTPIEKIYTVNYTDLGIEEVVDKQSFLDYFGNIQVNCQQSQIIFKADRWGNVDNVLQTQFKDIGSFDRQVDEYEFELPILSLNNDLEGWENKQLGGDYDHKYYIQINTRHGERPYYDLALATTLKMVVKIKIENNIQISISDKTDIIGWRGYSEIAEHSGYPWQDINICSTHDRVVYSAGLSYDMWLNQVKFIKRGNGHKVSNRKYGINGTETH